MERAGVRRIIVNGCLFEVELSRVQGIQIRALAGVPAEHVLILEGAGAAEDRLLNDNDVVSLEAGSVHIYSKPPTAFGSISPAGDDW